MLEMKVNESIGQFKLVAEGSAKDLISDLAYANCRIIVSFANEINLPLETVRDMVIAGLDMELLYEVNVGLNENSK